MKKQLKLFIKMNIRILEINGHKNGVLILTVVTQHSLLAQNQETQKHSNYFYYIESDLIARFYWVFFFLFALFKVQNVNRNINVICVVFISIKTIDLNRNMDQYYFTIIKHL